MNHHESPLIIINGDDFRSDYWMINGDEWMMNGCGNIINSPDHASPVGMWIWHLTIDSPLVILMGFSTINHPFWGTLICEGQWGNSGIIITFTLW